MFRLNLTILLLIAGGILTAACAPVPSPSASESVPVATLAQPTQIPTASGEEDEPEIFVETVGFDGQNTFLDWVSSVLATEGEPVSRSFVELFDEAEITWQGERLDYAERQIWLLQPARRGGTLGVRIVSRGTAPDAISPEMFAAHLPAVDSDEAAAPDVDIRFVRARLQNERWSFDVTLAHPDTGWEDYVDGWQVETPEGEILAVRILLHPHETEQPFTRSQGGVAIPTGVDEVVIRTHDLVSGYGPGALRVSVVENATTDMYEVIR